MISVLMPTYNVEKYVTEAVDSILNQTYKDFELIIVDDCSTDKTFEILEQKAAFDSRIKLFRNNENLKICKTLNYAYSVARGEYIARMDGDDVCSSNRLEVLLEFLKQNPECGIVGSQVKSIDERGEFLSKKEYLTTNRYIKRFLELQCCILHIWLARKVVYDDLQGYRDIPYAEDYDFLFRARNAGYALANVSDYLYSVRIRTGNTISAYGLEQRKAKYFVRRLNVEERKKGCELFTTELYKEAVSCTSKQKERFEKASESFRNALNEHEHIVRKCAFLCSAMLKSKYIFFHVVETMIISFAVKCERMKGKSR